MLELITPGNDEMLQCPGKCVKSDGTGAVTMPIVSINHNKPFDRNLRNAYRDEKNKRRESDGVPQGSSLCFMLDRRKGGWKEGRREWKRGEGEKLSISLAALHFQKIPQQCESELEDK